MSDRILPFSVFYTPRDKNGKAKGAGRTIPARQPIPADMKLSKKAENMMAEETARQSRLDSAALEAAKEQGRNEEKARAQREHDAAKAAWAKMTPEERKAHKAKTDAAKKTE